MVACKDVNGKCAKSHALFECCYESLHYTAIRGDLNHWRVLLHVIFLESPDFNNVFLILTYMRKRISFFRTNVRAESLYMFIAMLLYCNSSYGQCAGINSVQEPQQFTWTYHPASTNNAEAYYSGVMH